MSVRKHGFALLLGLCLSVYASASCSNATLIGNYGFTITGVNSSNSLTAAVGQLTADGKGNFTGIQAVSDAGAISSNVALSGKYSLKASCNGTATISSGGTAANFRMVVVSNGAQFEITKTDAGTSQYGYALAQGKATCTNAGIKNTYGFRGGGYTAPSMAHNAWVGQIKLDGLGGVTGSESASFGGSPQSFLLTGTYNVNSNCTGTATFNGGANQSNTYFVIVNGGLSAMQIETDANTINTNFVQK